MWVDELSNKLTDGSCIQPVGSKPFLILWADETTVRYLRTGTVPVSESRAHVIYNLQIILLSWFKYTYFQYKNEFVRMVLEYECNQRH
jgi:hypothetical protein